MFAGVLRRHKLLSTMCLGGIGCGVYLSDRRRRELVYEEVKGTTRGIDFVCTFASILVTYKWEFRNVEPEDAEYGEIYHKVNLQCAERALRLFKRLGGYFVKFGQMISTLDQGIPVEWMETMANCQDKATPVPFSSMARVIEEDLGVHYKDIFAEIDEYPIGCASLAQVHRAVLKTGEEVAVKIQYPFIRNFTKKDMAVCEWATKVVKWLFPNFEFTWFIPRFRENVLREIDFTTEVTNINNCREFFKHNPAIYIPFVFDHLCSDRICCMEYIHGIKVSDVQQLRSQGIDTKEVAALCVEAFAQMIFQAPFLHVDPHPGNMLVRVLPANSRHYSAQSKMHPQLVLLDHGMYNYMQEGFRSFMQELWLAMVQQDEKHVYELCSVYGMQRFSQLLSLAFTGRSLSSQNKFGEEMGSELYKSIETRMVKAMESMSGEMFNRRLGLVSQMMEAMPTDLMYVFRVVQMMQGLLHLLGASESTRLTIMTSAAMKGKYGSSSIPFFTTLRWKVYLWLLQFRLWLNDLYIEWILRRMMQQGYEMELDPDVVFKKLIREDE